jgi:hypothetical protein
MKNVILKWSCLLMVVSAAFIGCSKDDDDDDNVVKSEMLVGTWEIVSGRSYDKDADGVISNESQDNYTETFRYVFMEDGFFESQGAQVFTGSWSLEGKKLSVMLSGVSKYDVVKLNTSELILESSSDRGTYKRCTETTFTKI